MLTDDKKFRQYIEGPEEGVALAYSRITNATSHMGIVELGRSQGGSRRFPYWSMRWLPVEPEDLRIAIVSDRRGLPIERKWTSTKCPLASSASPTW
ncbi:BLUF domain-containing protein [Stenotrophomonas bentonitica]|uniref:BLUF domain-containing protein n=1 Tax=Stenotrophomonas bentonitica TaxID=1450134 RepID=UPI00345F0AB1